MRVLLGFKTTDKNHRYQRRAARCLSTWLARLPEGYDFLTASGNRLGVPDRYEDLGLITQAVCRIGLARGYDKLLMCDDDIFVRWEHVTIPEAEYAGLIIAPAGEPRSYCQGGFFWMGRNAMQLVADAVMDDAAEDRWVGKVLVRAGIDPVSMPEYCFSPCECGADLCKPDPVPPNWAVMMELDRWPGAWERAEQQSRAAS